MSTAKNFILDTNVLLHDPNAIFSFEENHLHIPITVIEEIDRFKKDLNETGRNARQVSRILDDLREQGSLAEGVRLPGDGRIKVAMYRREMLDSLPPELHEDKADNRILAVALSIRNGGKVPTKLITKDTNLRIKADVCGVAAEDYEHGKVVFEDLYTGHKTLSVSGERINETFRTGGLQWEEKDWCFNVEDELEPNECVTLVNENNSSHTALGRFHLRKDNVRGTAIKPLSKEISAGVWGISPKNREQHFALDLLLDDEVKLVTLVGQAGTGKTLLAIAAGLHKVMDKGSYTRLLVSRPVFPMGRDIGFLPGEIEEKLAPWMQPIFDNVEYLLSGYNEENATSSRGKKNEKAAGRMNRSYKELLAMGVMEIEALTYIRGRSIPNQFLIVDEAQNLTPHEVKTIITRAGEGTKIVLTGDPCQIDNPYVDASSNGLTYIVEHFRSETIAGHITLTRGERSELARIAAAIL